MNLVELAEGKMSGKLFSDFWIYCNDDQKSIISQIVEQAILAEREACAKICEDLAVFWKKEATRVDLNEDAKVHCVGRRSIAAACATQIRARSNAPETPNKALESSENLQSSTFPASVMKTCS